jgi:hypothetical protein
MYLSKC